MEAAELEDYARLQEGALFGVDDPKGGRTSDWDWQYVADFDLSLIEDAEYTRQWWIDFLQEDIEAKREFGFPDFYKSLIESPIEEPIVAVIVDGRAWLWDGWHRTAVSHLREITTIKAVIGTPKSPF